jgi:hypothetical protein
VVARGPKPGHGEPHQRIDRHHGSDQAAHPPIARTSAAGRDYAGRATIAFRKSNRPDTT